MCLNLKDYPYKMSRQGNIYINPVVTRNQKPTINIHTHTHTQETEKKENHQTSKKENF